MCIRDRHPPACGPPFNGASEPTSPLCWRPPVCVLKAVAASWPLGGIRQTDLSKLLVPSLAAITWLASVSSAVQAQVRRTLPEGTVILVQTRQPLASQNVKAGQTFDTPVSYTHLRAHETGR